MQAAKRKKMREIKEKDGKGKCFTFVASMASSITSIHPSKVAYILNMTCIGGISTEIPEKNQGFM